MDIRRYRWTNAGLADAAAMVSYALLHRLVDRAYDGNPPGALHNTILQAIPELVSSEPVHQLWALSRLVREDAALTELFTDDARSIVRRLRRDPSYAAFRAPFDRYLEGWGFRCSAELMLTLPSYQEQPEPLIETIRAYCDARRRFAQGVAVATDRRSRYPRPRAPRPRPRTPALSLDAVDQLWIRAPDGNAMDAGVDWLSGAGTVETGAAL